MKVMVGTSGTVRRHPMDVFVVASLLRVTRSSSSRGKHYLTVILSQRQVHMRILNQHILLRIVHRFCLPFVWLTHELGSSFPHLFKDTSVLGSSSSTCTGCIQKLPGPGIQVRFESRAANVALVKLESSNLRPSSVRFILSRRFWHYARLPHADLYLSCPGI